MKKTVCVLLTMALIFSLAGCGEEKEQTSSIDSQTETASVASQKEKEPVTYKLYYSLPMGDTEGVDVPEGVFVGDARDIPFPSSSNGVKVDTSGAKKEIEFTLEEKSFQLSLIDGDSDGYSSDPVFNARLNLLEYYGKNGRSKVDVWYDSTGTELRLFNIYGIIDYPTSGPFTREMAIERSEDLFIELYGEERLAGYTIDELYLHDWAQRFHMVVYRRFVGKYRTEDVVSFEYDYNGNLMCVNALRMGYFDNMIETLTEADVDAGIQAATEKLGRELGFDENKGAILETDVNGVCYISGYSGNNIYYFNIT